MLLIMGEGLTRRHRQFLSMVVELQISVLHKNNNGTFTLLFILKDFFSRRTHRLEIQKVLLLGHT